jgi:phosphate starvation-inducible PhoH-like protein
MYKNPPINKMSLVKRRGNNNRKQTTRHIEEELAHYNLGKETSSKECMKTVFENFHYLSAKEKSLVDAKFSKPKNKSQARFVHMLNNTNHKIIIATGPAGTGKTLFGTEYGVKNFLMGKYEKMIFTRPAVSTDEDLGFLPGTLEDKMAPWIRPIYDILYKFMSPAEVTHLLEEKIIEIAPLGYMRGRTFKNTWIVADEMQNSTQNQMKMLLTRLGENSRMVITGDLDQHDRIGEINGLHDFLDKFRGCRSSSISSIEFEMGDIEREEVVKEILEIYGGSVPTLYVMDRSSSPELSSKDSDTSSETP